MNRAGSPRRLFVPVLALALAGCSGGAGRGTSSSQGPAPGERTAIATLHPTLGHTAHGTVTFVEKPDGILVVADVQGLSPGEHGFHIHEFGDCSAPDGSSAGGHFNPTNMPHGGPDSPQRHVGDLGNLTAGPDSTAHYERLDSHLAFEGDSSILGRSVVVHQKADDFKTQPSGNAGARIACGVIEGQP